MTYGTYHGLPVCVSMELYMYMYNYDITWQGWTGVRGSLFFNTSFLPCLIVIASGGGVIDCGANTTRSVSVMKRAQDMNKRGVRTREMRTRVNV